MIHFIGQPIEIMNNLSFITAYECVPGLPSLIILLPYYTAQKLPSRSAISYRNEQKAA
jgi:hypothetical protein